MTKMGRPAVPWGRNKSRDPNRRNIIEKTNVNLKGMTAEELKEYKKKVYDEAQRRNKSEDKRLEYLREPNELLKNMKESWEEFYGRVKQNNKRRLDEILSDKELMWKVFADRDDLSTKEKDIMLEKSKERKTYITDKEIDAIENYIYGGGKKIGLDDEEPTEGDEWFNPYTK